MLSKWKAKAIIQKAISFLPYKENINYFFQRYVTKGVLLNEEHFTYKLEHARDHLQFFEELKGGIQGKRVLELGTGWYPIVPIAFFLYDVGEFISIDISSWMNYESQLATIAVFQEWEEEDKLKDVLPDIKTENWNILIEILENKEKYPNSTTINQALRFTPYIKDARNSGFETNSFDFICSNNTFEHIYPEILKPILKEFDRIVKSNGAMSHFIDLSDHFAHFDASINIYNFLRFSEQQWRRIDNSIQPQNRLRWKDYEQIYKELGISYTALKVRKGDLALLASVPLSEEYSAYTPEELALSHGYMVTDT